MRRCGARCSRKVSSGRPCKVIVAQSASGQPSRAAARLKALRCGTIVISSRGKRRARVAPTPYHIGSPLANTATLAPRRASIASIVGRERAFPTDPLGAVVRHHAEMARAADQHLGGFDQRPRRRREAGDPVLADADDGEPGPHPALASALTAAAASALPPRRPWRVMNSSPCPKAASAAFASAAPTNPTGKPRTSAGFGAPLRQQLEQSKERGRRVADRNHRALQMRPPSARPPRPSAWSALPRPALPSRDRAGCRRCGSDRL